VNFIPLQQIYRKMSYQIINSDCLTAFEQKSIKNKVDLTFLDPPFNQQKNYVFHDDNMDDEAYWQMMKKVCQHTFDITTQGGAVYFMHREKNVEFVLQALRESGWSFQNLIIWKKKTSAVPVATKYSKQYQIIVYATKGERAKSFHRLRIDPELPAGYKYQRENGLFVTDVWDDIRELTSGYLAGPEAIRHDNGDRFHKQQAPLALLLRIILTSSKVGDTIFDPFCGTGTTSVVAHQLQRHSIGIEIDPDNVACIKDRLDNIRDADIIQKYYKDYLCSDNLAQIWGKTFEVRETKKKETLTLFGN
jgi:site-specific DNA-methyltransferase (adenine-specific)